MYQIRHQRGTNQCLRAIILKHTSRVPASSSQIYYRVINDYGSISVRNLVAMLSKMVNENKLVRIGKGNQVKYIHV
jgi:hypothetical protein